MKDITLTNRARHFSLTLWYQVTLTKVLRCGTFCGSMLSAFAVWPVVVAFGSQYAFAQDPVPIQTVLIAEIRENYEVSDGKQTQRLVPATVVNQGDIVYYTVQIRNPTTLPAPAVTIVQRIPANTTYVPSSASGPSTDITFSVDGGRTFSREKGLVVASPDGMSRRAMPADITHIRWQLRNVLAPGAIALARFQAVFQ